MANPTPPPLSAEAMYVDWLVDNTGQGRIPELMAAYAAHYASLLQATIDRQYSDLQLSAQSSAEKDKRIEELTQQVALLEALAATKPTEGT